MAYARLWDKPAPEEPAKSSFQLLVVDDEKVSRDLLRYILESAGYSRVDEAESGQAALAALGRKEYHLVLLDRNMPGTNGMVVLQEGKVVQPDCEFILITAYGSMETAVQAMDLGAFGYVTKPFSDIQVILRRVDRALERVRIRRQNAVLLERLDAAVAELALVQARLERPDDSRGAAPGQDQQMVARARQTINRLRDLAAQLRNFKQKSKGPSALVFAKLGDEVSSLADLLAGRPSPSAP